MIDVTVSYRPSEENDYRLDTIPANIQLALYKYEFYLKNRKLLLESLKENASKIKVVHLPLDSLRISWTAIRELIFGIYSRTGCINFVIHPNAGIYNFIETFSQEFKQINLCVETFAWRTRKVFRTPLEITEACMLHKNVWMTIDTCHIEELWFDHRIMSYLLKFTKVIHLSNRAKGLGSHLPFNHPEGELKLVSFIRDLKYKYKWTGTVVLEYMKEHSHKLIKNLKYAERLLGE